MTSCLNVCSVRIWKDWNDIMKIKGLRTSVQYAKACPSGHYVEWFARPIKGGWEVDTTGYLSNSWTTNYYAWDGWYYLNVTMYTVRVRYEYDNNKKPSLSTVIRLACNVLESKVIR